MNTKYRLIVGHDFSFADDTNSDAMSDYNPGIWAIKTQKSALKIGRDILARGDEITVTDYNNPQYHALANMFIKELGLNQPLFEEPKALVSEAVTNGMPSNLSQLKKYLTPGKKLKIVNYRGSGEEISRETFVKRIQTNSVVLDKSGGDSWLEFGKSTEWTFNNESATKHYIGRDGKSEPSSKIVYIINQ